VISQEESKALSSFESEGIQTQIQAGRFDSLLNQYQHRPDENLADLLLTTFELNGAAKQ
jgi:hypothetical protein